MVQSDRFRWHHAFDVYLWSVLFGSVVFSLICPEFVQSALQGNLNLALIPEGITTRFRAATQLFQGSDDETQAKGDHLFGRVGQLGPGAIAIGNAEGTLKRNGTPTQFYYGHRDPANQAMNRGFASWQASAVKNAREADQKALHRIKTQCVPYTVKSFQQQDLRLTNRLLVESCDIWIQAPKAAADFAWNLKGCQERGLFGDDAILCARVRNFINPLTGQFEVAAIFRHPGALEADQRRRMEEIGNTLKRFRV